MIQTGMQRIPMSERGEDVGFVPAGCFAAGEGEGNQDQGEDGDEEDESRDVELPE